MQIKVIREPAFAIIIDDVFSDDINRDIFEEFIKNEKDFNPAIVGTEENAQTNTDIRDNLTAFYDELYNDRRNDSVLLRELDGLFQNDDIKSLMQTSPLPLSIFSETNNHETQVSRYGDKNHYEYHVDSLGPSGDKRLITFVYYAQKEPHTFSGGEVEITGSVIVGHQPIEDIKPILIQPINNRLVIFGAYTPHRVKPVTAGKAFDEGRFSVNCWIGTRR